MRQVWYCATRPVKTNDNLMLIKIIADIRGGQAVVHEANAVQAACGTLNFEVDESLISCCGNESLQKKGGNTLHMHGTFVNFWKENASIYTKD